MVISTYISLKQDGPISRIIIDRAEKRNAMTQAMWSSFSALLATVRSDASCRVLIIESAVKGFFSAGADIKEFLELARDESKRKPNRDAMVGALGALAAMPMPTIAKIDGVVRGAGVALAMAADFRFISKASDFAITPAKLGILYPLEDIKRLVNLVGQQQAKRLLFTAAVIDTEGAKAIGLVDEVAANLDEKVEAFTQTLLDHSPSSIAGIKQLISRVSAGQSEDSEETAKAFMDAYGTDDFAEGATAFFEKRKPIFK